MDEASSGPNWFVWLIVFMVLALAVGGGAGLHHYLQKEDGDIGPVDSSSTDEKPPTLLTTPVPVTPTTPAPSTHASLPAPTPAPTVPPTQGTIPVTTPTPISSKTFSPERVLDASKIARLKQEVLDRIDAANESSWKDGKSAAKAVVRNLKDLVHAVTVTFDPGKSELTPAAELQIKRALADKLVKDMRSRDEDAVFVILGFADTAGSPAANARLSKSRADTVKKLLVSDKELQVKEKVEALGIGQTELLGGKRENRAAEVWLAIAPK